MFTLQPIEEMKINQDKENLMMITETYTKKKIFKVPILYYFPNRTSPNENII